MGDSESNRSPNDFSFSTSMAPEVVFIFTGLLLASPNTYVFLERESASEWQSGKHEE